MKAKLLASILGVLALFATYAADEYSVWNPNGSGSWSDASRWQDGNVPSSGGNVLIDGAEAYVTDADYALLKSLTRLRFRNGGSLDMRFNEDHTDFAVNSIMDTSGNAGGTLIKSGSGLLVHADSRNFKVEKFIVTNGVLQLNYAPGMTVSSTVIAQNIFGAYGDGVLVFNDSFTASGVTKVTINGLVGDGTVSNNLTSMRVEFAGGTRRNPMVFSGTLGKNIEPTFVSGCQYFIKPERPGISTPIRVYGGFAGVSKFGAAENDAGSLGTYGYLARFQGEGGGVVYAGTGETTAKKVAFDDFVCSATLDAGPNGGVTFTGDFDGRNCDRVIPLTLAGDNLATATIQSSFIGASTTTFPIVKKGAGTWRFSNVARYYLGTFSVEDGTLEYASMAAAGTACSLGTTARLTLPEAKTYANSTIVPWAFCLGTHSTTGTFAYVGSSDVSCTNRLFVLKGTGVVKSDTSASLFYKGATSFDNEGANTLVLDGSGSWDNFSDVTNGVGSLSVEKRGTGTWTLGGNVTLSGGIAAKGGTLRIANGPYRWYRFTVKKLQDGGARYLEFKQFRLSAADGTQCTASSEESSETKDASKNFRLGEDECMWNHGVSLSKDDRGLNNVFKLAGMVSAQRNGTTKRPAPSDSSTWVSFTFRISDDAKPVAYYDLQAQNSNADRQPKDWMLEASCDGRNWDVIDTQADQGVSADGYRWYSSDVTSFDEAHPGYPIASAPSGVTTEIGPVTIAGGTLDVASPVEISSLTIDASSSDGVLKGVTFASEGVINVVNANFPSGSRDLELPLTLSGCGNLDNLSGWTLNLNGVPNTRLDVRVFNGRVSLSKRGFVLIYR